MRPQGLFRPSCVQRCIGSRRQTPPSFGAERVAILGGSGAPPLNNSAQACGGDVMPDPLRMPWRPWTMAASTATSGSTRRRRRLWVDQGGGGRTRHRSQLAMINSGLSGRLAERTAKNPGQTSHQDNTGPPPHYVAIVLQPRSGGAGQRWPEIRPQGAGDRSRIPAEKRQRSP